MDLKHASPRKSPHAKTQVTSPGWSCAPCQKANTEDQDHPRGPHSPKILRSDSDLYCSTVPRTPEILQVRGAKSAAPPHFGDRVKGLERARTSSLVQIPGSDDSSVLRLTEELRKRGLTGRWVLPREAREELEAELQLATEELLQKLVIVAQHLAKPVISVFHVGAAALGQSGNVYMGPNVEICSGIYASNICGFHYVLHAEQAAVLTAFSSGEQSIKSVHVSHTPCGHCRQFMTELPNHEDIEVWTPQIGRRMTLGELLPHSFGPADLGKSEFMLGPKIPNPVVMAANAEARRMDPELAAEVEKAAQLAHAPYTSSYAGVVLRTANGRYCRGSSLESAAYNPSVTPMQMALVSLFAQGGRVEDIETACLAEDPSSPISYKGGDNALLAAVAPWVSMWLMPLTGAVPPFPSPATPA